VLFASKIGWAGIAFILATTGMLGQGSPRSPARSGSGTEIVSVFVVKDEIRKMQETLRGKGLYKGKVDGVFGLRTRASIRAYQKAGNLPITGQVDTQTAAGLGVRPESAWDNSQSDGRQVGHSIHFIVGEFDKDKPSAGIQRTASRPRTTARKEVSTAAIEDSPGGGANKQQPANEEHNQ